MSDYDDSFLKSLVSYQEQLNSADAVERTKIGEDCSLPLEALQKLAENQQCLDFIDKIRRMVAYQSPHEVTELLPTTIGKFQVLSQLGMGGFGIVFHAKDPDNNRSVAIKIPRPEILMSEDHVRRFRNEARTAAQLDHPNIVQVFDSGAEGVVPYIVMPYVTGGNLAIWRDQQRKIAPREAAEIVMHLARGMAHAHSRGILHRDIKPSNVLLEPVGEMKNGSFLKFIPKLTDFGLAKQENSEEDLTRSGLTPGTSSYMSPEQVLGSSKDVTAKSDIFSLSIILYELLSGTHPFRSHSESETLNNLNLTELIPSRQYRLSVPRDLQAICLKGLEKKPEQRYRSADELADDLERFLDGRTVLARPANLLKKTLKWGKRHPLLAMASTILSVSLCLLICVTFYYNNKLQILLVQSERGRVTVEKQSFAIRQRSCMTDTRLAQSAWSQGNTKQALRLLKRHFPGKGEKDVRSFAWWHLWKEFNDTTRILGEHADQITSVAPHPSGHLVASSCRDGVIKIWDLESLDKVSSLRGHESGSINCVVFSPSGDSLVSVGDDSAICFWDTLDWSLRKQIHLDGGKINRASFSADGDLLAVAGVDSVIHIRAASTGEPLQTLDGHQKEISDLTFHPTERILASTSKDGTIRVWDFRAGEKPKQFVIQVPRPENWCRSLAFSPVGDRLAGGSIMNDTFVWSTADGDMGELIDAEKQYPNARSLCWPAANRLYKADITGSVTEFQIADRALRKTKKILLDEEIFVGRTSTRHSQAINSLHKVPHSSFFVSGSEDRTIRLWKVLQSLELVPADLRDQEPFKTASHREFNRMYWTPSKLFIMTHEGVRNDIGWDSEDSFLHVFSKIEEPVQHRLTMPSGQDIAVSPSGGKLIQAYHEGRLTLMNTHTRKQDWERSLPPFLHPDYIHGVPVINNLETHFILAWGSDLYFGDLRTGEMEEPLKNEYFTPSVIFVNEESGPLNAISGDDRGNVHLWNLEGGGIKKRLWTSLGSSINSLSLSPSRQRLAIGLSNGSAVVFLYPEMEKIAEFSHEDVVTKMEFCNQDRILVSSSVRTHFWDLENESELLCFPEPVSLHWENTHEELFTRCSGPFAVSPDRDRVAVILQGEMRLIDLSPPSEQAR
ncbi:Serine/threonine-protein kinase PrkC [Polystyrenella longa]|uniref:Serine/threonine-protein kinase PrkC n=1 Tax=Polystyrenella longa TaxID=2528007 RepID=A0A518CTA1_9PLAN|nr:protein kinase [Polystyrenella longa]QDU82435.1 Serine/threonine-protein kinase PrkC [Polystyrenella longa]